MVEEAEGMKQDSAEQTFVCGASVNNQSLLSFLLRFNPDSKEADFTCRADGVCVDVRVYTECVPNCRIMQIPTSALHCIIYFFVGLFFFFSPFFVKAYKLLFLPR